MGNEAKCAVEFDGTAGEAKVLLETDELIVRAPFRLKIPFAEMKKVEADKTHLRLRWSSHELSVAIGGEAQKWAEKIRNPKSLADKLGIKAGQRISVAGELEKSFTADLAARGADVSTRLRSESDVIFLAIERREELDRLVGIVASLREDGALWVVRPKGTPAISESEVMAAGKRAGLVDVKVARFSPTHTAEKFVIPVPNRAKRHK